MTKPKPSHLHRANPRRLTAPLDEQPRKQRRNRARYLAFRLLAARHPSEFRGLYRDELVKVGLE